jgi:hypothetical protein
VTPGEGFEASVVAAIEQSERLKRLESRIAVLAGDIALLQKGIPRRDTVPLESTIADVTAIPVTDPATEVQRLVGALSSERARLAVVRSALGPFVKRAEEIEAWIHRVDSDAPNRPDHGMIPRESWIALLRAIRASGGLP